MASGGVDEAGEPVNDDLSVYFSEMDDIESSVHESNESEEDLSKTPDEGEQEKYWLKEVGLSNLVSKFEDGKDISDEVLKKETATLTRKQAAAVQRRVATLNATRRGKHKDKHKEKHKTDIRDMFSGVDISSGAKDHSTEQGSDTRPTSDQPVQLRHNAHAKEKRRNGHMTHGDFTFHNHESDNNSNNVDQATDDHHTKRVTVVRLPSRGEYSGSDTISIQTREIDDSRPRGTLYEPRSTQGADDVFSPTEPTTVTLRKKPSSIDKSDGLPHFIPEPDELGHTHIDDVSQRDAQKIRNLCLIELTALYDMHNLSWQRQRAKRRHTENGIFAVPLQTLYDQDIKKYPYIKVPLFFDQLIDHLERCAWYEEGILRVPGSVSRIKQLRQEVEEKFQSGRFSWEDVLPYDGASLLKQLLRELPVPLLTFEYIDAFRQLNSLEDKTRKQQLQALNLLVLLLPPVHRNVLQMLLRFLRKIVGFGENKMTLDNVAMIMAPNLFCVMRKNSKSKMPTIQEVDIMMAAGSFNTVRMMIKYQDILWTVPSFIIDQVRFQYEAEQNRKSKDRINFMKYFGKKDKDNTKKERIMSDPDMGENVIRVQAPHLSKDSTRVHLEHEMTAKDIVVKFYHAQIAVSKRAQMIKDSRSSSSEEALSPDDPFFLTTHLYEVGGNIGERKLRHDANMMALYRVNPGAQWIVRTDGT